MKSTRRFPSVANWLVAMVLTWTGLSGATNAASMVPAPARASTEAEPFTIVNATLSDTMHITLDRYSVPAGDVRFHVTNAGHLEHELVVLKTDLAPDGLPANADSPGKAMEQVHMGETGDIPGGRFSGLQLQLGAGNYVIICNEVGHYSAGMHVAFTVTAPVVSVSLDDHLTIGLDRATLYAGPVVFAITNHGAMTHEFIVLATSAAPSTIAADPEQPGKVSEDGNIGESGDVPAGRFSGLGLTLTPGTYLLICNEPGHFAGGMHLQLTVLPAPSGDE